MLLSRTNPLSITVDSEYFDFASTAATPTTDVTTTAAAPTATAANANGTRAFTSLMTFDAGNYASILCQSDVVGTTAPAPTDPTAEDACGEGNRD